MPEPSPLARTRAAALRALLPPERLRSLADWCERHLYLGDGSAQPGRFRPHPYQREFLDAIGDPEVERVTGCFAVRTGKTTGLIAGILARQLNEPGPAGMIAPTDGDARNFMVADLEPVAEALPLARGLFAMEADPRNTMTDRRVPGGSLRIRAAASPRNLAGHTWRDLFMDEVDRFEPTREGSATALAEKRTFSFANRKIVLVSTPTYDETSEILRAYRRSDQRVFEIRCPGCGDYFELLWRNIEWPDGDPAAAHAVAPCCGTVIEHREKAAAVAAGRWRATAPEVRGHAGFRLSALVSPLANAAWAKLASEFLEAKKSPDTLQVFVNTILAEGWREAAEEADPADLEARAEGFTLELPPPECLVLTAGLDVQHDRVECTFLGHTAAGVALVLSHSIIWGSPGDDSTWQEVDALLSSTWPHPAGGTLRLDAAAIDSGDGTWTAKVYDFCRPRLSRRIFAIKGASGSRPPFTRSGGKQPLWIVGVDGLKSQIYRRLERGGSIRFGADLGAEYFSQIASERVVVRYHRGQPVRQFQRVPGRRAEGLDYLVYALAVRHGVNVNLDAREVELASRSAPTVAPRVARSSWMERGAAF